MPDHDALLVALRRFARTMPGRYDLPDVLHDLGTQVCEVFGATGAGMTLVNERGDLQFVTATSEQVVGAEKAQEQFQSGPCRSSIEAGRPVVVNDIRHHDDWPGYRDVAEGLGLRAVLGLPMVLDAERIGSLDIYSAVPRQWTDEQIKAAEVLTDIASSYILNASELARTRRKSEQLEAALESRVVIEQAKGRLSGDLGISVDEAFDRLRRHARSNNRKLRDVAQDVIDHGSAAVSEA